MFVGRPATYVHANCILADFQPIVTAYPTQIDDKLQAIHNAYMKLKTNERRIVREAYYNNNDIEGICSGIVKPYKYDDLPVGMRTSLKNLYDELWNPVLGYTEVEAKCGTLKDHFKAFRKKNKKSVCPYCGLDGLLNEYNDLKNAYDHYIPKSQYPFCSIQFKNLAPICDECNKAGNKGSKDIPFKPKTATQRPLYFPYDKIRNHKIKLSIISPSTNLEALSKWILNIDCVPAKNIDKKNTWNEIFNIEKRYKALIANESYKWKDKIILDYGRDKKRVGFDVNHFISDKISDYSDIENQKDAIVKKCFHEFFLNHSSFKKSITGVI